MIQERADRLALQLRFASPPETGTIERLRGNLSSHLRQAGGTGVEMLIQLTGDMDEPELEFRSFISRLAPPALH